MYRFKGVSSLKMIKAQKRIKSVDMAKDLGMTKQYFYLIENKVIRVSPELKKKICDYLGVKPSVVDWWCNMSNKKAIMSFGFKPKAGSKITTGLINKFTPPFAPAMKAPANNTNDSSGISYKDYHDNLCDLEREQILKEYEIRKAMAIDRALNLAYYKRDLAKACYNTQLNILSSVMNILADNGRELENYIDNVELRQGKPIDEIKSNSKFLNGGVVDNNITTENGDNNLRKAVINKLNTPIEKI